MAVWIVHDPITDRACLYDSVTERPFGPGILPTEGLGAGEAASTFLIWLAEDRDIEDPRGLSETRLERLYADWCDLNEADG